MLLIRISFALLFLEIQKTLKEHMDYLPEDEVKLNIERLTEFCAQHSWGVIYSTKKQNLFYKRTIQLYKNRRPEILFYIFLHEVGHAWMLECDFTYQDRFSELLRQPLRYASVTYKISKVQEEIEAWDVGRQLARSLGLRINNAKFEKIRAECLGSYMNWAGKPRGRNKNGIVK